VFDNRQDRTWRVALLRLSKGHDRDQVQEATLHRDVSYVGAPDLIGPVDCHALEQIRINSMRRVRRAGSRRLIDRLEAHQPHQAPHTMTADADSFPSQLTDHLAAAVKRMLHEQLVDPTHQRPVLRALALRCVIERRPADRQNRALPAQAQGGMIAPHHGLALSPPHRPSPLAKKSLTTVSSPILA